MEKYIIALARGGLGNRMKCLISAMRMAEGESRELILFWPVDSDCACCFSDLFENKISQIGRFQLNQLIDKEDFVRSYRVCDTWRLLTFPQDTLPPNFSQAYVSEKGDNIDFEYGRIPLLVRENILKYIKRLEPNKYILEKADEFGGKFDDDTVSVNIRSWAGEERSPLFDIGNVYRIMDKKKNGLFFAVCDSPEVLERLKFRYGGRILFYPRRTFPGDRRSGEGIQDALIELLLLAKNKNLVVSYLSTFSEMAWWLGGCQAKVEAIPAPFNGRLSMFGDQVKARIKRFLKIPRE